MILLCQSLLLTPTSPANPVPGWEGGVEGVGGGTIRWQLVLKAMLRFDRVAQPCMRVNAARSN